MYIDFIPMLDASGKVLPYLFEAKKRASYLMFDTAGKLVYNQAVPAIHQGFLPDSISTICTSPA